MIIAVDFDGTLALGNEPYISMLKPNKALIERLRAAKKYCTIKVVTARGDKSGMTEQEKERKYKRLIEDWLRQYNVPYDELSFKKEYANLYIDDLAISPYAEFTAQESHFTKNHIILTENSVIKHSKTAPHEKRWYDVVLTMVNVPKVLFCNDNIIITERLYGKPITAEKAITELRYFSTLPVIDRGDWQSYVDNIPNSPIKESLKKYDLVKGFFHGDFSVNNTFDVGGSIYFIDPNDKVFGNYLTDAGKLLFTFIAYQQDMDSAKKIVKAFGDIAWLLAAAEGLRVAKYDPAYKDIALNIYDIYLETQ